MLKVFTYYDSSVKEFFVKSLISVASALVEEELDLIIICSESIPKSVLSQLDRVYLSITTTGYSGKYDMRLPQSDRSAYFSDYLLEYTDYDRLYVDSNLFFLRSFGIPKDTGLFFRQHNGKLSTSLCYLKAGDHIKRAVFAIKRDINLTVTSDEFTFLVANNYLISKVISPYQIINGKLLESIKVTDLSNFNAVAIDTMDIANSPLTSVRSLINSESRKQVLQALSYIKRKKKQTNVSAFGLFPKLDKITPIFKKRKQPSLSGKSLLFMVTTYNRLDFLKQTISSWEATRNKKHKWTLIISDDGSSDGTVEYLNSLIIPDTTIILVSHARRGVHHQTNSLIKTALSLEFDFGFKVDDDVLFLKSGWDDSYIHAADITKYDHLIFFDRQWKNSIRKMRQPVYKDDILVNFVKPDDVQGAFWTFTKKVLTDVGFFDTDSFNLCGLGHVDYSMRCSRLGHNSLDTPFDLIDSNEYLSLIKDKYFSNNSYSAIWNTPNQLNKKREILNTYRTYVGYNELSVNILRESIISKLEINQLTVNSYFDHVYCLNLDRRPEKWKAVNRRFSKFGIAVERFSAIDGNFIDSKYLKNHPRLNKYEIGCMLSHYRIIQDAKEKGYQRILIFEDDVLLCKDFNQKFIQKISKLPNWKVLYLGASQWVWNDLKFIEDFYLADKTDSTFAYALDQSVYDDFLQTSNIKNRPIDNKLFDIQEKYQGQCFVSFPNLVIADVSSSDIRNSRENQTHRVKMKWNLEDYE